MRSTPTEPEHVRSTSHAAPARPELHPTMLRRFLAYYKPERGLLIADTVCALVIAGIDLAFPSILRALTGGLFMEGRNAILGALGYIALGLVVMYLVRMGCRYFVSAQGHIMRAWSRACARTSSTSTSASASRTSTA